MTHSLPVSFSLRDDYHEEVGWQDFVRDQTTTNPDCIRQILAHPARGLLGADPMTRLQRWEPLLPGFMFYYWLIRAGDPAPCFVASDALFSLIMTPLPDDAHLIGLPEELLELSHDALTPSGGAAPMPSPLLPRRPEGGSVARVILPELLVVHRYPLARATLHPCAETLQALHRDPLDWWGRQPPMPGLWG